MVKCLPSPEDRGTQYGTSPKSGEQEARKAERGEPFSAMVFKTISDPFTGKLTLFRVYSGVVKSDSTVFNPIV